MSRQRIQVCYTPNEKQLLFHQSMSDMVLYGGAKGGGKSCALVMDAFLYAMQNEGAIIYLFRESYDDLEANLIREWKSKVPLELYTYAETKHIAKLKQTGSEVIFRYISNDQDAEGYQGRSMDYVGVDECTKHNKRAIQILLSCLRSPKGYHPRFRATANPGGRGHQWCKEDFVLATDYGKRVASDPVTGQSIEFIPAKVYDNYVIMENDPNYVKRLENLPELERKAFLDGSWDLIEGQFFDKWDPKIHIVEPFDIPSYWNRYISIDYGMDTTAAVWWAVDRQGYCYAYRELHEPKLILSAAAKRIIEMTPAGEEIKYIVASPDLWNKRQETGASGAEVMFNAGLKGLIKANNARIPGWRAMREMLEPTMDEHGEPAAMIRFFPCCRNAIRNIPMLQYDEANSEDASDEPHSITHINESIRYFCMSRPRMSNKTKVETWTWDHEKPQGENYSIDASYINY